MAESDIEKSARRYAYDILTGTVLAVDPASGGSSDPGFAVYRCGVLVDSGVIPLLRAGAIQQRLQLLYSGLHRFACEVLVVERIRGPRSHEYLHWSVGVAVAATCPRVLIEMPVSTWKMHAGTGHLKNDENDAKAIGQALVTLAERTHGR